MELTDTLLHIIDIRITYSLIWLKNLLLVQDVDEIEKGLRSNGLAYKRNIVLIFVPSIKQYRSFVVSMLDERDQKKSRYKHISLDNPTKYSLHFAHCGISKQNEWACF